MLQRSITLHLPMPLNVTFVNSYLLQTEHGFFLIDCGMSSGRRTLELELNQAGCHPGDLKLVLLTHGDFDHIGNAAFLQTKYKARLAIHADDLEMLTLGNMFYNRVMDRPVMKTLMSTFFRLGKDNFCQPDVLLKDGDSLLDSGLDAQVLNTPGHSKGSVCFLLKNGDLFCGDLFTNSYARPVLNSMLYDKKAGIESFERLKKLPIQTVYPGHGKAFPWQALFP